MKDVEILVVGAGLAGLSAARALGRRGHDVLVLEARAHAGGRLASQALGNGARPELGRVDLGGQWHGPGQNRIIALATELGLETYETHTAGKTRYEFMGRSGSYRGAAPLSEPLAFLGASFGLSKLSRLANEWGHPTARQALSPATLDEQSLGAWIGRNVWPESARHLARFMFQSLFCCAPDEVSLLLVLDWLSKCGPIEHLLGVAGGSQERQFVGGTARLLERLESELTSRIAFDRPVRRIRRDDSGAVVAGDDFELRARRVAIAIPPPLILEIDFTPELDGSRTRALSCFTMGSVVKCALIYERPFWREQGLSGEMWSDEGPLTGAYDTSPPGSACGVLSGLAAGPHAARLAALTLEQRKQLVLSGLVRQLGSRAASPLEYLDRVWSNEPWTRGGYSAHLPPGYFTPAYAALHEPEGVLHWAGTETAASWPGYMEGALESSERVVAELTSRQPEPQGCRRSTSRIGCTSSGERGRSGSGFPKETNPAS